MVGREAGRCALTPEEIQKIRQMLAFNVSWHIIARRLGSTVKECRAAINMPVFDKPTERQSMPWDKSQQALPFDKKFDGAI